MKKRKQEGKKEGGSEEKREGKKGGRKRGREVRRERGSNCYGDCTAKAFISQVRKFCSLNKH